MKSFKFNGWLPVFTGFYGTIFQSDNNESNEIDKFTEIRQEKRLQGDIDFYSDVQFDYDAYNKNVAKQCCKYLEFELQQLSIVLSLKYDSVSSPREYNFTNDSINCEYELTVDNIKSIKQYVKANIADFCKYIESRYTSCSGFMSHYSNNIIDWMNSTHIKLNYNNEHQFSSIIQFICDNEGIDDYSMYESLEVYINLTDNQYDNVTNKHYCNDCQEFYTTEHDFGKGEQEKYKDIVGHYPLITRDIDLCPCCNNEICV